MLKILRVEAIPVALPLLNVQIPISGVFGFYTVAPLLVVRPLLRERQPEVEQRMVVFRDIAHEDADLAVIDFAPVPTPLPFDPDRVRAALGETARIEGDDAIGMS